MAVWINLIKIRYFISRFVYLLSVVKGSNATPFRLRSINLFLNQSDDRFWNCRCRFCRFSFYVKEVYGNGKFPFKNLSKLKLRQKEDKRYITWHVADIQNNAYGVCTKCFANVEKLRRFCSIAKNSKHFKNKANFVQTTEYKKKKFLISPPVICTYFKPLKSD